MLGKTVLVYSADRPGSRRLRGCLRAAGSDVVVVDKPKLATELIAAQVVDLVLFDYAMAWDLSSLAWAGVGKTPFVVMASDFDADVLRETFCRYDIAHVIGRSDGGDTLAAIDVREVVVTVEKILQKDVFGANKYLPDFAIDRTTHEVAGASDRDDLVERVQAYLRWIGARRDVVTAMGQVVDELVTNAVYNAPRDEHGNPRYAALNRREKIELDPWERATVEFGSDGSVFVFSISDWFGSLTMDRLRDTLRRCLSDGDQIEQKDGGAGIGLYTILKSVSQLIINVEPGKRTEVVAIAELDRKRRAQSRGHSLQVFMHNSAREEDAVVVSNELRRELISAIVAQQRPSATSDSQDQAGGLGP